LPGRTSGRSPGARAAALQAARDAARGRLLAFGAGLFAALALWYTAQNFTLSRRNVQLTEQGQVTDRYAKAIEQLGSGKLDVHIGASTRWSAWVAIRPACTASELDAGTVTCGLAV
jgi:hypothetical protein